MLYSNLNIARDPVDANKQEGMSLIQILIKVLFFC